MNSTTVVTTEQVRRLNLSHADVLFLRLFAQKEYDFQRFPEFETESNFTDPVPDINPTTAWFGERMEGLTEKVQEKSLRLLTRREEYELFRLYNWHRCRIYRFQTSWNARSKKSLTSREISQILKWNKSELLLETKIVSFNLALVLSMAQRSGQKQNAVGGFSDLVSEGLTGMLRAVRKFDATRGFKFSTYACQAILKAMFRETMKQQKNQRRNISMTRLTAGFSQDIADRLTSGTFVTRDTLPASQYTQERKAIVFGILRGTLDINLPEELILSEIERRALVTRYFPTCRSQLPTLEATGKTLKGSGQIITKERVRQILNAALEKLRLIILACETPVSERKDLDMGKNVALDLDNDRELEEAA